MNDSQKQLGPLSLIAVIIGSTIGSGIFTITADMAAAGAHTGAILIGWLICGIGMLGLMMCYFGLNKVRPDLTNGVYSYAGEGFGEYIGFTSAWGYWVSALLCNVSYLTLLFGAIGYFIPAFGTGNNLLSIVLASVFLWLINYLVLRGMQEAAIINIVTTIAKLVPLLVFVVAVIFIGAFDPAVFMNNFWGVGSLGVRTPAVKAALATPQRAGILEYAVGPWGAALINIGVILSLAGALLGWTILAADCPYSAAQQGGFMEAFRRANRHGSPAFSLYLTNGLIQLFLIICYFSASTYQAFYALSTSMIMIPYLLSAAYYLKLSLKGDGFERLGGGSIAIESNMDAPGGSRAVALVFAFIGTIYGFWMLYSGGLDYVLITTVLYAPGLLVFIRGRHEKNLPIFTRKTEKAAAAAVLVLAVISIYMMATGRLNPF